MCLHIIYITIDETTNEIIAVTNRKNVYNTIIKKENFCLPNLNHYYAFLANQKIPFYSNTGEQSPSMFLVLSVGEYQDQKIVEKLVMSGHE